MSAAVNPVSDDAYDAPALVGHLAATRLFGVLPRAAIEQLARAVSRRTYRRGHVFYYAGDLSSGLIIVERGLVALTGADEQGSVHGILALGAGDLFGLASMILGRRRSTTAIALVDSTVLLIPKDAFDQLFLRFPELSRQTAIELSEALHHSEQTTLRVTLTPVTARVARFLLESANRAGVKEEDLRAFDLALSHQDLALLLGTTRETVTRALGRLARAGAIALGDRHLAIASREALARFADATKAAS